MMSEKQIIQKKKRFFSLKNSFLFLAHLTSCRKYHPISFNFFEFNSQKWIKFHALSNRSDVLNNSVVSISNTNWSFIFFIYHFGVGTFGARRKKC